MGGRLARIALDSLPRKGLGLIPRTRRPRRPGGPSLPRAPGAPTPAARRAESPRVVPGKARVGVDIDRPFGVVPSGVTNVPVIGPEAQLATVLTGIIPGRPGSRATRGAPAPHLVAPLVHTCPRRGAPRRGSTTAPPVGTHPTCVVPARGVGDAGVPIGRAS